MPVLERAPILIAAISPLSHFRLFDAEAFEKMHQGRGKIVELNICEDHPMKKNKEIWGVCAMRQGPSVACVPLPTIVAGQTDEQSRTDV